MNEKLHASEKPAPKHQRSGVAKESHHERVSVDEFDQEQMGIAAKE